MKATFNRFFALVSGVIVLGCEVAIALPGGDGLKEIDFPNGGHLVFGPMAGQLTP